MSENLQAAVKTWEKTRVQNLMRHKSGRYYARLYLNGKEVWKPLKTSHFSVAETRIAVALKENREQRKRETDTANVKMSFGEAAKLQLRHVDADGRLKRRTRMYWHEVDTALQKSWLDLYKTEIRKLTPAMCREWAIRYSKIVSATRYNGAISYFRHVMKLAIENDVLHVDPTFAIKRMPVRGKDLELPSRAQFTAFITEMRNGHSRDSNNCADLVLGLAFTGCRISEAAQIEWRDLDFDNGEIFVRGDPEERTKNGEMRRVPMIAEARDLFLAMRQPRAYEASTAKVFLVRESQNAQGRRRTCYAYLWPSAARTQRSPSAKGLIHPHPSSRCYFVRCESRASAACRAEGAEGRSFSPETIEGGFLGDVDWRRAVKKDCQASTWYSVKSSFVQRFAELFQSFLREICRFRPNVANNLTQWSKNCDQTPLIVGDSFSRRFNARRK